MDGSCFSPLAVHECRIQPKAPNAQPSTAEGDKQAQTTQHRSDKHPQIDYFPLVPRGRNVELKHHFIRKWVEIKQIP